VRKILTRRANNKQKKGRRVQTFADRESWTPSIVEDIKRDHTRHTRDVGMPDFVEEDDLFFFFSLSSVLCVVCLVDRVQEKEQTLGGTNGY
jgi:hypothetical protein